MRRVRIAVAALAAATVLLLAGCGDEVEQILQPDEEPAESAEDEPVTAPLTGEEVDNGTVLDRPVVAIKIDNAPRARPQVGLDDSDIIFTEIVEGGTTRFIALYHSRLPETVGPVRSGRDVDAQILPPFSAVFGISGAAEPTYDALRGADLLVYEEGQADAFRREGSRPKPHDLFADPEALADAAGDLPPAEEPWPFEADVPEGGEEATGVSLTFSPFYSAAWEWRDSEWLRRQEDETHVDEDGDQLGAATVVVARVVAFEGTGVDVGGNPVPEVEAVGEGDALVLRDGQAFPARWRKDTAESHFEWLTPEGDVLPLRPGRTWVELVPEEGRVDVAGPAGEG